jgi:hypothetical protein
MLPAKTEADLWRDHVASLALALEMRKPDALARLRLAVEKLDREISACALRREIRARAGVDLGAVSAALNTLEGRMESLRAIAGHVRATLLDHDAGPSPESAAKAREIVNGDGELTGDYVAASPSIDDLNSDLKRAASDIQYGWAAITKGAAVAVSGKAFGGFEMGPKAEILAKQYHAWVREMHRKRMGTWIFDDVVCNGMSRAECALKRRCHPETVYAQLVDGLALYADTYAPLSE